MSEKNLKRITKGYEYVIMVFMMIFGLVIAAYFALSIYELVLPLFQHLTHEDFTDISKNILSAFLFLEFLVIIKDYFSSNANIHFEDYLYVAVTAIIRSILVYHDNALKTLLLCGAILILVIAIILYKRYQTQNNKLSDSEHGR
ncbi:phosphate-starvation-inducible PsiE family protein [Weissella viridescens]|uniref:phosphate-starvation-inducible PsiE family protein n=1 Tax=Weissella viridescens TaxID=1629 RepID=UPI0027DD8511|nr:phosphate-starvation-inducible PsiE family protein [uncultured Weissella sp.]